MVLIDPYGRKLTGLRMSVTSRCNLRCIYCHHEGEVCVGREISREMAVNVVNAASRLGIRSVKITGGEPLMRRDLEEMIAGFREVAPGVEISITTNGVYLKERAERLAAAGLSRANISLDSLDPDRYRRITGAKEGDLERVLDGIEAALVSGLKPVKLNMVVLKENECEIPGMIEFSRRSGVILQLIELLGDGPKGDLESVERRIEAQADGFLTREMHRRRKYFLDGAVVEIVRPMDNTEFCAHCTRLRVTSDGRLKPCLLRNDNLLEIKSTDPDEIERLILEVVRRREPFFRGANSER
ncbi:MAG TPA: GTP 3',8-cyclase MoaA [Methanothrix sp.]|nr:GTP 3',8-cyclase MoaA [Methanothrix sp.]HOK57986.1 GTP 3',8-cyclase MoaA [Methanothrix sp.]HOL43389.1 GTP 3',8-cyclase MoaA [Methanothrix sp.]HPO88392.1 GTP 3',8-cyclase MoaA [Methanothrix sp.]